MELKGNIIFTTVGRPDYGFDVFSFDHSTATERRLTDGVSVNFNAQFVDDNQQIAFVSERTGSARIYQTRSGSARPVQLPSVPHSLFHDRPAVRNGSVYFISAHEQPDRHFKSWTALYRAETTNKAFEVSRLTPHGIADYSPAVSLSGDYIAVASYGSRSWLGDFRELVTGIVVFRNSEPNKRVTVCERGGWPTWSGDSTIFFHRQAEDGWWSIFRVDLPENIHENGSCNFPIAPTRVTPPGVHSFTPAAFHDGKKIVVATRRSGTKYRHIELFDLESGTFDSVTKSINPSFHHYNPFVSPDSRYIGYHRCRGESTQGESTIPHLEPIASPVRGLLLLRLNGSFPASLPGGDLIAFNPDFNDTNGGIRIINSNGSRRWTLLKNRTAFCNSWSPTESYTIYTSLGPIFQSPSRAVQIARISFNQSALNGDDEELACDVTILTRDDTGNNAFPSCSSDGKSLVFRSGRSGHKNLYIIDAVEGEFNGRIRRLTEGPWIDTMPCWSPKGDLIAFSSNRHNPENSEAFSIYLIKPDGSDLRRVNVVDSDWDRERINHVSFSPDGKWLVFTANMGAVTAEPVSAPNQFQPYGELYVVRVDGTGLTRLTWNGYEDGTPTWYGGADLDLERLNLGGEIGSGDKLKGQFDEPLWISCDM